MTHEERAKILATINGWYVDQDDNFACMFGCDVPDVLTNIAPTDIGAWGMLCDMEGIDVPDFIDQETIDQANDNHVDTALRRIMSELLTETLR